MVIVPQDCVWMKRAERHEDCPTSRPTTISGNFAEALTDKSKEFMAITLRGKRVGV